MTEIIIISIVTFILGIFIKNTFERISIRSTHIPTEARIALDRASDKTRQQIEDMRMEQAIKRTALDMVEQYMKAESDSKLRRWQYPGQPEYFYNICPIIIRNPSLGAYMYTISDEETAKYRKLCIDDLILDEYERLLDEYKTKTGFFSYLNK